MIKIINKKRNVIDRIKAKLGRYYKIFKPAIKVLLGISLEGKNTTFVINSSKKEPKKFFRARVYTLEKLINIVRSKSENTPSYNEEIRELLETFPLLLYHIAMTKERWYIGKIENHPFDIFIAAERFVHIENNNVDIYRGLHIQTKRLYQYPPKRMSLNEWIVFFQSVIEEKITPVDFGFNGHIHFYNLISFDESININEMKKRLEKMYIPFNKYIDSISLSMELVNLKKETAVVTWTIYPFFSMCGVLELDLETAKNIYLENNIAETMLKAIHSDKIKL